MTLARARELTEASPCLPQRRLLLLSHFSRVRLCATDKVSIRAEETKGESLDVEIGSRQLRKTHSMLTMGTTQAGITSKRVGRGVCQLVQRI